jgi:starch synthase
MIALRYGTVPIVRATGGLADTVVDDDADPTNGNGFTFGPAGPDALLEACGRAITAWADRKRWWRIMARGMAADHSWDRPAAEYEVAYARAVGLRRS